MKKLLILLILLPVLAMGQFGLMDSTKIVRHIYNTLTIEDPIWFTPITTADLLEYEKYCYADSIVEYEYMIEYWNGISFDTIYSKEILYLPESYIIQVPKKYKHQQPTFKGFIEWVKK